MHIYIETYGCAASQSDSEIMNGILTKAEHNCKSTIDSADIILITTCDVKSVTEQKITDRAIMLSKKYPSKKLILVGCMVDNRIEKLRKLLPDASFVSTHRITEINKTIEQPGLTLLRNNQAPIAKTCLPRVRKDSTIGIVQISEGCRGACTFCSTKLAKGTIRSFPMNTILKDISTLVTDSCTKIYLTSQDTAAYGYDTAGKSLLPELLEKISQTPGNFQVRIGMMNPDNVISALTDLTKVYRSNKIMKFLHLPVQSGSNEILKAMNRHYNIDQFKKIISEFRKTYPEIVIWTDVIIGYPGESNDQFEATLQLLKDISPNYTNISRFAKREGTPSSKLKQLDTQEMKRRTRICSELVQSLKH